MELKKITQKQLDKAIKLHQKWLEDSNKGKRLDFSYCDCSGLNFSKADLSNAVLRYADLSNAVLRYADLRYADLRYADLSNAVLIYAVLRYAIGVTLELYNKNRLTPEEGSFICYKKCIDSNNIQYVVTLEVPAEAKRVNAIGSRKIRVSYAKVIKIETLQGSSVLSDISVFGKNKQNLEYKLNSIVVPDSFDESYTKECSHGIHAFISKIEAIEW